MMGNVIKNNLLVNNRIPMMKVDGKNKKLGESQCERKKLLLKKKGVIINKKMGAMTNRNYCTILITTAVSAVAPHA